MLHGKDGYIVPFLFQEFLQIDRTDTISAPGIIEFIGQYDFHYFIGYFAGAFPVFMEGVVIKNLEQSESLFYVIRIIGQCLQTKAQYPQGISGNTDY